MAALATNPPASKPIPVTFLSSVKSWWATGEKEAEQAELRLLKRLPSFRTASEPNAPTGVNSRISKVELGSPSRALNTLSMLPTQQTPGAPATVILHGYGAGLGFFTLNFPSLAQWADTRSSPVYAVDWLGMGRSSRVPFRIKASKSDTEGRVKETEDFFVESLEEWRVKMNLEKMTLVGHSLGGYLSTAYALRYPSRVERLVLLSPAGIPAKEDTTIPSQEMEPPKASTRSPGHNAEPATKQNVKQLKEEQVEEKKQESWGRKLATCAWEEGVSPFGLLRGLSVWAPLLVGKYSARRFPSLSEDEVRDFHDYILNISMLKGSGEYAYSHLLSFGAHARLPLEHRVSPLKMPVTFVYGSHDWMDPEGGIRAVQNLRKAGNRKARVQIIPDAGHHLYLDNAPATNDLLLQELDNALLSAARRGASTSSA